MTASITVAIVNMILNTILIRQFGYKAAAYTTLFCYIIFCMLHYVFMKKAIRSVYGNNTKVEVVDLSFIIAISIFMIIVTNLIIVVYPYNWLRYIIILVISTCIIIFRKYIFSLLRILKSK